MSNTIVLDAARIEGELASVNVTEAVIAKLKEQYEGLGDAPVENEEGYEPIHRADLALRDVQNLAISILKKERDPAIAYQKLCVAKEKEIVARIAAIRDPITARKKEWNERKEKQLAEDVARHAAVLRARKERLFEAGFRFDGTKYVLEGYGELTEEEVSGSDVSDLQLAEWLLDIEKQVIEHKEREEEKERTAKIATEALQKQQEQESARLLAERAEIDRKAAEIAAMETAMNARVNDSRRNELLAAGMSSQSPCSDLHLLSEEEFTVRVAQVREDKLKYDKLLEEEARIAEEQRLASEAHIREEARLKGIADEQARVAREAAQAVERKKEEERKETERIAALDDRGKVEMLIGHYVALPVPLLTSESGLALMKRIAQCRTLLVEITTKFVAQ